MIRHVIDDSTAKKSRLLDREFIPKTEHLEMQFLHFFVPPNYVITANLTTQI